jgi:hypothetical protein
MTALVDLSLVRCAQGACADALPHLRQALELARSNYTTKSIPVGFIHFLLGYAEWKTGDETSASDSMKAGVAEMEGQLGGGHPTYVSALTQYEVFLKQTGHAGDAAEVRARIDRLNTARRMGGAVLQAGN